MFKVTTQIERKRKLWTIVEKKEGTKPTQGLSQFLICDRGWSCPMIIWLLALSTSPPWWLRRVNQIWQNQRLRLFWQLSKYQDPSTLSAPTLVKSLNDINMWHSYTWVLVLRVANITGGTKNDYLWKIDPLRSQIIRLISWLWRTKIFETTCAGCIHKAKLF